MILGRPVFCTIPLILVLNERAWQWSAICIPCNGASSYIFVLLFLFLEQIFIRYHRKRAGNFLGNEETLSSIYRVDYNQLKVEKKHSYFQLCWLSKFCYGW